MGVIGSGSTGLQLTKALAPIAAHFELFQRTPQWILPWTSFAYPGFVKALHRRWPGLAKVEGRAWDVVTVLRYGNAMIKAGWERTMIAAACTLHLQTIRDARLRERFTPNYEAGCKRLVVGNGFYRLLVPSSGRHTDDLAVDGRASQGTAGAGRAARLGIRPHDRAGLLVPRGTRWR